MASGLHHFIGLAATKCGYSGTVEELLVEWVHPFLLEAKAAANK